MNDGENLCVFLPADGAEKATILLQIHTTGDDSFDDPSVKRVHGIEVTQYNG